MTEMLLCLSRQQRLAYVLSAVFEVSDTMAAKILDAPRATFRKRLQRARADLHNFMGGNCGLINKSNSCRCARKTRAFFEAGRLYLHELRFQYDRVAPAGEVATRDAGVLSEKLANEYPALYRPTRPTPRTRTLYTVLPVIELRVRPCLRWLPLVVAKFRHAPVPER